MELIFSNKPSAINKKIIRFLDLNLKSLNKANLIFDFQVAHPDESSKFKKMGINSFPVLMPKNASQVVGVDSIIDYLKTEVSKHNKKISNITDSDRIKDYWDKTLDISIDESGKHKFTEDDGENEDISDNLQHKIQEAFAERNKTTETIPKSNSRIQQKNIIAKSGSADESPVETLNKMSAKGQASIDDQLMAKFFENQEESV